MRKFLSLGLLYLLSHCILPAQSTICWVDPSGDFHERMPLILKANADEFIYPNKCGSKTLRLTFQDSLRAACPADTINVFGSNTNLAEAKLSCYGITLFGLGGTSYAGPFRQIRCNRIPEAEVQTSTTPCNNNTGTISKIGFRVSSSSFVPTIEEICQDVNQTYWTHHKVVPGLTRRNKLPALGGGGGGLWGGEGWGGWLGSTSTTTQSTTTIAAGDNQVIDTFLVPREDMFYRAQQDSSFFRINTVPMYKSVRDGNWRLIEDIARKLANTRRQCATLDVWTGRYNGTNTTSSEPTTTTEAATTSSTTMSTPTSTDASTTESATPTSTDASTTPSTTVSTSTSTDASTTSSTTVPTTTSTDASSTPGMGSRSSRQLQVRATTPRFLFKMLVDRSRNRGIVFVTLNDPTLTAITPNEQLCAAYAQCANAYPQFNVVSRGYTHCCTLDAFASVAVQLGLPTFPNAQPLI